MKRHIADRGVCAVCGQRRPLYELLPVSVLRAPMADFIRTRLPPLAATDLICYTDLNHFREQYVENVLLAERGELTSLEREIVQSLSSHDVLARDIDRDFEQQLPFGARLADRIAEFGGSWKFITTFALILLGWIVLNTVALVARPFDPYPFILLNLVLSCLAALQAPVIMMSQNRQEEKDRLRAMHDYRVNLRAELEIRHLHEKVDHLLLHQWQRLMEIQQIQVELMEELAARRTDHTPPRAQG